MTTEPYVPDDAEVRDQFATRMAPHLDETRRRSFDRWLARRDAKIKADALREAAIGVTTQVNNAEVAEADISIDPGPYHHGARYGMRKTAQWLHDRADRIELEA